MGEGGLVDVITGVVVGVIVGVRVANGELIIALGVTVGVRVALFIVGEGLCCRQESLLWPKDACRLSTCCTARELSKARAVLLSMTIIINITIRLILLDLLNLLRFLGILICIIGN